MHSWIIELLLDGVEQIIFKNAAYGFKVFAVVDSSRGAICNDANTTRNIAQMFCLLFFARRRIPVNFLLLIITETGLFFYLEVVDGYLLAAGKRVGIIKVVILLDYQIIKFVPGLRV